MIQVNKIFIKDFKRIKEEGIELKPITALVGGNTSGKSSVLQASQLCVSLCQASFVRKKSNGKIDFLKTLANEAVSYRPTETLLSLRHGEPANQTKSFELGFECVDMKATTQKSTTLKVSITRGKNANLALNIYGDEQLIGILGDRDKPFSIFTPGLSGIPLREEWRTRGALDAAAMHGDANLYLRTLLDHLLRKKLDSTIVQKWLEEDIEIEELPNTPWRKFSELLDKCYPGARIFVRHDSEKDRFVSVEVSYLGQRSPLDMASTGMLQVVQILAYACFYEPPLLLLDEPDAHLHADSQTKLHSALQKIVETMGTKIILATHSPQLIQHILADPNAAVVWMDKGKVMNVKAGERPAIPLLMELGALTLGAEAFDSKNKLIVLTEDSDTTFIRTFLKANGAKNFACLSYHGCSNLSGARQLAGLLRELRPEVKVIIHRDRDFRTEEEIEFETVLARELYQREEITDVVELFTPLNDVEHSFLNEDHLIECLKGRAVKELKIKELLSNALAFKRDDIINSVRKARDVLARDLYESDRMKKKTKLRIEAGIPDKAPSHKSFLPQNGLEPINIINAHGKTAFRAFEKELHGYIKGDSKEIRPILMIESKYLKSKSWADAIK